MTESWPGATAQRIATRLAVHQLLDDPRVFDDPLAFDIIGSDRALTLRTDPYRFETAVQSSYLRAFVAARSRCAEDELALGIQRGVRQYVILSAGLATFAYRNPYPRGTLRVFEVDHPETQRWKRSRLAEIGISPPPDLTFVPIDFDRQTLAEGLPGTDYDPGTLTFFSWLGATEYLSTEAVLSTLRFIAASRTGSEAVFDYTISPSELTPGRRSRFEALAQLVASAGTPWQSFFNPASLARELHAMGFRYVQDNGPEEINTRYFANRKDGLQVGDLSHMIIARV
jgi:methyltransferase (TIGR00027 family)